MENKTYKKVVLVILDGFGVASYGHGNAIALAEIEIINFIVSYYPSLALQASGPLVGLPWGEVGNSEVGHLNIGAGRIVGQDLQRINRSIQDRNFFSSQVLIGAMEHVKLHKSKLHVAGMISDGGVHSSADHLYALLGMAMEQNIDEVYIHMFTDGRDTAEKAALESIQKLRHKVKEIGVGKIATIGGRFYAMDRGKHWNQTSLMYDAMVKGSGVSAYSAEDAVLDSYGKQVFDEVIQPCVIFEQSSDGQTSTVATIDKDDAVVFFNFRPDRMLQLAQMFTGSDVVPEEFKKPQVENLYIATMTDYFFGMPVKVVFPIKELKNNLAESVSKNGLKQFHIAESEKYAHVTSFFNGGEDKQFENEERVIVESPNNANNYSDHPEMSGLELTDILCQKIKESDNNFFVANFANSDVVGHTGNLQASIKAVSYLDRFLGKIKDVVLEEDGVMIITSDHGNIEQMISSRTGDIDKDHTTNPVPFLIVAEQLKFIKQSQKNYLSLSGRVPDGVISDIAPTILELFGLERPKEMDAISLMGIVRDQLNQQNAK